MTCRTKLVTGKLCSIAVALGVLGAVSAADDWPTRWDVNGNGETGTLEFTVDDEGLVTGRLFGESIEGFANGRQIVIRRDAGDRTELWEGWLSSVAPDSSRIVAGSISAQEDGATRVYPWFGTQVATAESEALAPADPPASPPPVAVPAPTDAPAPSATEKPSESAATPAGGPLAGIWTSLTGERMEIGQDGNRLTVITADGSSHSGRVTGESSLVIGLRKGCCNGRLESPDVIVWSDGARWQRTD